MSRAYTQIRLQTNIFELADGLRPREFKNIKRPCPRLCGRHPEVGYRWDCVTTSSQDSCHLLLTLRADDTLLPIPRSEHTALWGAISLRRNPRQSEEIQFRRTAKAPQ